MTLKEIIQELEEIATRQPNIHHIVKSGDIYDLNDTDIPYAAFCATQQTHTENEGFRTYNLNLFYVDRLRDEQNDKIDIQSHSIEILDNILNTFLENNYDVEITNRTFTTFTQKFLSLCAGAYVTISLSVPVDGCPELY